MTRWIDDGPEARKRPGRLCPGVGVGDEHGLRCFLQIANEERRKSSLTGLHFFQSSMTSASRDFAAPLAISSYFLVSSWTSFLMSSR